MLIHTCAQQFKLLCAGLALMGVKCTQPASSIISSNLLHYHWFTWTIRITCFYCSIPTSRFCSSDWVHSHISLDTLTVAYSVFLSITWHLSRLWIDTCWSFNAAALWSWFSAITIVNEVVFHSGGFICLFFFCNCTLHSSHRTCRIRPLKL